MSLDSLLDPTGEREAVSLPRICLLYTSDAADE